MRQFLARLTGLLHRGKAEREMAREIAAHLALLAEEFERSGMSAPAAAGEARRALGGVEQTKELHRDARTFVGVEQFGATSVMRRAICGARRAIRWRE